MELTFPDVTNFPEVEAFMDVHCFRMIESWIDSPEDLGWSADLYAMLYQVVYKSCNNNDNFSQYVYDMLHSKVQLVGYKYRKGSKERWFYATFVAHVFKYLDRFYVNRKSIPPLKESIEDAMDKGQAQEAGVIARRRWRLVKHRIVELEANSKVQAQVNLWLIKNGLKD